MSEKAVASAARMWRSAISDLGVRSAMLQAMDSSLPATHTPQAVAVDMAAGAVGSAAGDEEAGGGDQGGAGKKRKRRGRGSASDAAYVPLAERPTAESVEVRTKGRAQ